nr:hypothetical protein [Tanacetum cinerariifolium]
GWLPWGGGGEEVGVAGVAAVCRWPRWRGGDDGSGGARLEMEGVVAARDGEWGGGSCRSGDGEYFWGSPEKFSGGDGGGGGWPAAGGGGRQWPEGEL